MLSLISFLVPQLIVRNIDEKIVRKLKERAGRRGVSMEEEHRRILRDALIPERVGRPSLKEFLLGMPAVGEDTIFARRKDFGREVSL